MASVFEVGHLYEPAGVGFDPIEVIKKTEKTLFVRNEGAKWKMKLRYDEQGNEYVQDRCCPKSYWCEFTYRPEWVVTGESEEYFKTIYSENWKRREERK